MTEGNIQQDAIMYSPTVRTFWLRVKDANGAMVEERSVTDIEIEEGAVKLKAIQAAGRVSIQLHIQGDEE